MTEKSEYMDEYFRMLDSELERCKKHAGKAREKGYDPEQRVDVPLAATMADRVEGLISTVAPQLVDTDMAKRIEELEKKYTPQSWEIALIIAGEVAQQKFCSFSDKKEAIEVGIRTGMAYSTAGIVAAPLEGLVEVKIKKRQDGGEYLSSIYAGPIRGAGGTAAAVSVIISDYVRTKLGISKYDPTEQEVKRFVREIYDYHERVTNLQYLPSEGELEQLVRNLPVEVSGDPTEKLEVSNYKDLDRMESNLIRGGMCLVLAEGVSQKAVKLWKRLSSWGKDFGLEWDFLKEFLDIQKKAKAKSSGEKKTEQKVAPNYTFISDLVAGRPVFSYPLKVGGFRLRYGRSRCSGLSSAAIHPATMALLGEFIAVGTQLKTERPGKASAMSLTDDIEGPIVKLEDGSVVRVNSDEKAREVRKQVEEVLYLGDILANFGDFSENNHNLVPAGYCPEWWALELEKAVKEKLGSPVSKKLAESLGESEENLSGLFRDPINTEVSFELAKRISSRLDVPLHPHHTFFWGLISKEALIRLRESAKEAKVVREENRIKKLVISYDEQVKETLESLGAPHELASNEYIVFGPDESVILYDTLDIENYSEPQSQEVLGIVSELSGVRIRDRAGTFVGARMGRPEKAKMRKLTGSPHTLFPVGEEGGRLRSFQSAVENRKVTSDFPVYYCDKCNKERIYPYCEDCNSKTEKMYFVEDSGLTREESEKAVSYRKKEVDIANLFDRAVKQLGVKVYPDVIKGVRGTTNKERIPENLAKGILRAKHGVYVNKDGTTRYDMTELSLTHFKPDEIHTSVEKLKELGYNKDIYGNPLENGQQIVEMKPQDLVLPCNKDSFDDPGDRVLFNVANFIDNLLVNFYGLEPYYNLKKPSDLVGHIVVGLAPHISAGMVGRIIGFSNIQACFAHPLYHAALRRDCDGDENCVLLVMDAFLNFSRQYLPDKRGSRTMDSPLVLTSRLTPSEVDDMAHGVDVPWRYPLELY
ncbi:MAG: DNA polymerase II large subunit, partial [Nanobdellota archaeon]